MSQTLDGGGVAEDLPILVCPLEHERKALLAAGIHPALVETCGPGREGVRRWADRHPQLRRPVVLVGLAGGLDPDLISGSVVVAGEIIDAHGRVSAPPLVDELGLDLPVVRVATAGRLVASPEAKLALARATNASVVDLETSHFAEIGRAREWHWGVVRVVGDTAGEAIPTALERFVDHRGRTRLRTLASEVFRRPSLLPVLRRINTASRSALATLANELRRLQPIRTTPAPRPAHGGSPTTDAGPPVTLVFGGTFDPPHRGHIRLSFEAARRLGCREIIFVPARVSPLKQDTPPTSSEVRVRMLEAAISGFRSRGGGYGIASRVSRLEVDRPGPSYMIDTLRELHLVLNAEAGEDVDPRRRPRMRLLIGSDQALDFTQWRDWRAIVDLAPPVVMPRPPATRTSLAALYRERFPKDLAGRWSTWTLDLPTDGVSSTSVRERLERGEEVGELLAAEVWAIIDAEGLYRSS